MTRFDEIGGSRERAIDAICLVRFPLLFPYKSLDSPAFFVFFVFFVFLAGIRNLHIAVVIYWNTFKPFLLWFAIFTITL